MLGFVKLFRPRTLRLLTLLVLLTQVSPQAPLWVMQTAAWSRMLVSYSSEAGLVEGVARTFDGEHPCPWCVRIQAAREALDCAQWSAPAPPRVQGACPPDSPRLYSPAARLCAATTAVCPSAPPREPPPRPPPRLLV